jgi:hypothetical protein
LCSAGGTCSPPPRPPLPPCCVRARSASPAPPPQSRAPHAACSQTAGPAVHTHARTHTRAHARYIHQLSANRRWHSLGRRKRPTHLRSITSHTNSHSDQTQPTEKCLYCWRGPHINHTTNNPHLLEKLDVDGPLRPRLQGQPPDAVPPIAAYTPPYSLAGGAREAMGWKDLRRLGNFIWVRGEIRGSPECRNVGVSQSALIMIDPTISPRTRNISSERTCTCRT